MVSFGGQIWRPAADMKNLFIASPLELHGDFSKTLNMHSPQGLVVPKLKPFWSANQKGCYTATLKTEKRQLPTVLESCYRVSSEATQWILSKLGWMLPLGSSYVRMKMVPVRWPIRLLLLTWKIRQCEEGMEFCYRGFYWNLVWIFPLGVYLCLNDNCCFRLTYTPIFLSVMRYLFPKATF